MPPPSLQFGPYKTDRVLGRGGMGVVYAAVDTESGRQAAVKVLTTSMAGDLRLRDRFAGEIETLKLLKHPRIVELYGYGEQEGQLFYAMELVAGKSLQDEQVGGRRFDWREAARIGIDTCDALRHAHDHGVVHRDLKPANLILDAGGRVKLSDFGIAKMFGGSQLTADGGVLGTADYMSPEQAEGRPATVRSDLYSLGSVLYVLLSRKAPFESKTLPEVIRRLISEEPQRLSRLVPDLPDEFDELVHQLLRKSPDQRLPTALAVSKRLQALLEEHPEPRVELPPDDEYTLEESPPDPRGATMPDRERGTHPTMALPATPGKGASGAAYSAPNVAVHLRPTVVRPEDEPGMTIGRSIPVPTPTPEPVTRFTTVDKRAARRDEDDSQDRFLWLKLSGIGVVVALLAAGAAYVFWPASADTLYGQIAAAAHSDSPERLSELEGEIDSFLKRFAKDERAAEVSAWKEEVERRRLRKRFERQSRRLGGDKSDSVVEKLYLAALEDARFAPERAVSKLTALVDLFGNDASATEETRNCVELAREEIKTLQAGLAAAEKEQRELLQARLDEAEKLYGKDPAAAAAIWRGAVALYSEKPWAEELVSHAHEKLKAIEKK